MIAAFSLARLALMPTFGLGADESYSRRDRAPARAFLFRPSAAASMDRAFRRAGVRRNRFRVRLPFVALFAATGWLIHAMTRDLFGERAGLIALFALNAAPFFLASAGGWVVPDGPLAFALSAAAYAAARLFFRQPGGGEAWALWLVIGLCLGLAGLRNISPR